MADIFSKWIKGLDKTRKVTFSRLASVFGTNEIDDYLWDDLEEILIQADLEIDTSADILKSLKRTAADQGLFKANDLVKFLKIELINRLKDVPDPFQDAKMQNLLLS
jgi:fused signal recognition particle receptor